MLAIFARKNFGAEVIGDFGELFQPGIENFDDFLTEDATIGELVGFFGAFVSEPFMIGKAPSPAARYRGRAPGGR